MHGIKVNVVAASFDMLDVGFLLYLSHYRKPEEEVIAPLALDLNLGMGLYVGVETGWLDLVQRIKHLGLKIFLSCKYLRLHMVCEKVHMFLESCEDLPFLLSWLFIGCRW